jgi:Glu-tRNA(Gln) amidotransferase subunit E-like FAD-binding protein
MLEIKLEERKLEIPISLKIGEEIFEETVNPIRNISHSNKVKLFQKWQLAKEKGEEVASEKYKKLFEAEFNEDVELFIIESQFNFYNLYFETQNFSQEFRGFFNSLNDDDQKLVFEKLIEHINKEVEGN